MSLAEKQKQLIEDLNLLPDPQERLSALVQRGARHHLPDEVKTPELRIPGCVSGVWVHVEPAAEGHLRFTCDADSPLVKGLAACLCDLYSDSTAAEITTVEPELWQACALHKALSPTRLNGLTALRQRIVQLSHSL